MAVTVCCAQSSISGKINSLTISQFERSCPGLTWPEDYLSFVSGGTDPVVAVVLNVYTTMSFAFVKFVRVLFLYLFAYVFA